MSTINNNQQLQGHVKFYCDGKGAIDAITNKFPTANPTRLHYDIIQSIWNIIDHSQIIWTFHHVKGHQDDLIEPQQLTRPEQLNIQADNQAKSYNYLLLAQESCPIYPVLPFQRFCIWANNQLITGNIKKQLFTILQLQRIRQYWYKNQRFPIGTRKFIDWDTIHRSYKLLNTTNLRTITKWNTGFCGVGQQLVKYNYQNYTNCPFCQTPHEDTQHVLQCPDITVQLEWDKQLNNLSQWMTDNQGEPIMIQQIIGRLRTWQRNEPILPNNATTPLLRHAISHQNRIGWQNLLEGFLTKEWVLIQEAYLTSINSRKSAILWWNKVQRKMWYIIIHMWKHRNKAVHERDGHTIHITEQEDINKAINHEWDIGLGNLPASHSNLFNKSRTIHLSDTYHRQRQWLASVWTAKERCDPTRDPVNASNTAFQRYQQWKKRKRHVFEHN